MAKRPWVTPSEVNAYTDYADVQKRSGAKLVIDIRRAEEYVIRYTNNRFDDEGYLELPESVRTAVILLAETYAHNAADAASGYKSETFDDYSYTKAENSVVDIETLDLGVLLDEYVIKAGGGNVNMKLRKL